MSHSKIHHILLLFLKLLANVTGNSAAVFFKKAIQADSQST